MSSLPLLVPVFVLGLVVAALACRRVGAWLRMPWWAAFVLIAGLGLVAALTLTPVRSGAVVVVDAVSLVPFTPDGPIVRPPTQWWRIDDRTLNVLVFIPIGFAVILVGRPAARIALVAGALALPWVIEGTQLVVTWLARGPQWQDVVDNTVGVLIGLLVGWVVARRLGPVRIRT
jgi:glycopeptide antibiotics resistance protein